MAKRIDKLTPEQEAMMPVWAKKWIDIGLQTGETDWTTFDKYMPVCYEKAGLKYPKNIVHVSSPLVGAFASSIANKFINKRDAVEDAVGGAVGDAVRDAVGGAVEGAVRDAVGGAVGGAVRDAVEGAVRDAVGGAVEGAVRGAVRDAVEDAVGGAVGDAVEGAVEDAVEDAVGGAVGGAKISWHYWLGGQFWVGYYWGSPSFVSFFTDVCGLEMTKDITERATAYRKVCESVNYIWCNRDFVMVCARPKHIDRNAQGRLHSDKRKSIEYPDGWGLYYLNGVRFSEDLWKKVTSGKMPYEDILNIPDVDQRAQALKYGDWNKFTEWQGAKMIDKHVKYDINGLDVPHELWEFPLQTGNKKIFNKSVNFARYLCPSTREWKVKGVPAFKTVAEAVSWGMSDNENLITADEWKRMIPLVNES